LEGALVIEKKKRRGLRASFKIQIDRQECLAQPASFDLAETFRKTRGRGKGEANG